MNFLLGKCVNCQQKVFENSFKDKKALKIFADKGICLACQRKSDSDTEQDLENNFDQE